MKDRSLVMERSGDFTVEVHGDKHCGITSSGVVKLKYKLVAECSSSDLDSRGFLFDQLTIDRHFKSTRQTTLSCEDLCIQSIDELLRAILKENPKCWVRKMILTLSADPYAASMTYCYIDKKGKKRDRILDELRRAQPVTVAVKEVVPKPIPLPAPIIRTEKKYTPYYDDPWYEEERYGSKRRDW